MRPEIAKFFENKPLDTVQLLKLLYDLGIGAGNDAVVFIDGRELVFARGEPSGRGFLRMTPMERGAVIAFPRGHELFDPLKRAKGPRGSETRLTVLLISEIDAYVRRLIASAYSLEEPVFDEFEF